MAAGAVSKSISEAIARRVGVPVPARVRVATTEPREPTTPATVLEGMKARPVERAPTGIAALDEQTKGGPRFCDLVALLGAPDAGKTTIATALADHYESAGYVVGVCCYDDDEEDLATRLAQRRNWTRGDVEARLDFETLLERMPSLFIYDATWPIETVVEDLSARAGDRSVVLVVDSLQTMNVAAAATASGKADAIGAGLRVLRHAAKALRWLVVFTSEMVRGSYSGVGDRTAALAAAKWSGDVEYFAKLVLAVRNEPDEPDLLHVEIAKSKLGPKGDFYLKLDRSRQKLEPAAAPDKAAAAQERKAAKAAQSDKERSAAFAKLTKIVLHTPGVGTRELRTKASAAGLGGRDRVDVLVQQALDAGVIVDRPEEHGQRVDHHYFAAAANAGGAP